MTTLQKRINKIVHNPRNVPSGELISLLLSLGFERRGGKGSHECFRHPAMPGVKLTVPRQNPLRKAYVIQALKAIQELMELEGDE